ncbi:MAG TPA: hypothetical protein VJ044_07750 [Candidatus Hodarchaeales archaeon]|nr:hypothetical protein [Candidatus Hodarchaeales archaeon]
MSDFDNSIAEIRAAITNSKQVKVGLLKQKEDLRAQALAVDTKITEVNLMIDNHQKSIAKLLT